MKFGKQFKKGMVPEWTEAYMDYSGLKEMLKQIVSSRRIRRQPTAPTTSLHRLFSGLQQPRESNATEEGSGDVEQVIDVATLHHGDSRQFYRTEFLRHFEEGGELEHNFFRKLDEELNKVNSFYREKVDAVMHESTLLNKQMDALVALRIKVRISETERSDTTVEMNDQQRNCGSSLQSDPGQSTDPGNSNEEDIREDPNSSRQDPLDILEHVKLKNTLQNPISTLKGVFKDSKHQNLSYNKDELKRAETRMRKAFIEFYHKLHLLKHYSFMNLSAFSKIMKKYDKRTRKKGTGDSDSLLLAFLQFSGRKAFRSYMRVVDDSFLGSSDEVNNLLQRAERAFIKHFSNSDRQQGMKLLRPKPRREKHRVTFFSGFFSGCSIALIVAIVLRLKLKKLDNEERNSYMTNVFPLYSFFGYVVLHVLIYAADIYFWKRYRINYTFIFGFKQGTELGYKDVFLLSTGIAVLALASFLGNLDLNLGTTTQSYKTLTRLFPLLLVGIVFLLMFCPFNIIYRPSRFFFIRTLFRCFCAPLYQVTFADFFLADNLTSQIQAIRSLDLYFCYYGLGEFAQRQNKCNSHGVYVALYYIVAIIPYWIRFLQCIRRLLEEKDPRQIYNGLKYLVTIIAVIIRTIYELEKGKVWMVLALVSSGLATTFCICWDIVLDWGLLRLRSRNVLLRDKLLVPYKSVYFIAMVVNVFLRMCWMQLVLEFRWRPFHRVAISTIISCLEIVRRGMWSFFRLENEHLNNVGKYRAFKSVPLPFSYDDENNADKTD